MKSKKIQLIKKIRKFLLNPDDKGQLADILKSAFDKNILDGDS